jgi:hypothetical protein
MDSLVLDIENITSRAKNEHYNNCFAKDPQPLTLNFVVHSSCSLHTDHNFFSRGIESNLRPLEAALLL